MQALESEKADIEKLLHDFSVQHTLRLGHLILQLLDYQRNRATTNYEQTEAEEDYRHYNQQYTDTRQQPRFNLTTDEQLELKRAFRKAAQLCHPDVVSDALKFQAEAFFTELKTANDHNDLPRVRQLLVQLEQGNFFLSRSETVTEKTLLYHERTRLQTLAERLRADVLLIRASETYQTIHQITDWDVYFTEKRQQLETQLESLLAVG